MQATPRHQTYPERPPGADLPPKKVCNLDPMAARSRQKRQLPEILRRHGPDRELTLCLRRSLGSSLIMNSRVKTGMSYLIEAETILEDVHRRFRRVFGESHPDTKHTEDKLIIARDLIRDLKVRAEEFESPEKA